MPNFNCKKCPAYQNVCELSNQDECCQALNENLAKLAVENSHSLQQLKAEIAALAKLLSGLSRREIYDGEHDQIAERMRQLSAV